MAGENEGKESKSILGLSTEQLAGLGVDELTNNPVAIKMLFHYYRQLVDDNTSLRNNNNTQRLREVSKQLIDRGDTVGC